jgi:hypothetical protein
MEEVDGLKNNKALIIKFIIGFALGAAGVSSYFLLK